MADGPAIPDISAKSGARAWPVPNGAKAPVPDRTCIRATDSELGISSLGTFFAGFFLLDPPESNLS